MEPRREDYLGREQSQRLVRRRRNLLNESNLVRSKMTSTSGEDGLLEEPGAGDGSVTLALLPNRCPSPESEEDGQVVVDNVEDHGSDSGIEFEGGEQARFVPISPSAVDAGLPERKPKERLRTMALQILLPFLMAGLGCVFAGMLLDHVEHWTLFADISELYILVPALLGLKGNLEMTLASRLSTAANLGQLDKKETLTKLVFGNMALIQGQALVVGASASALALLLDWVADGTFCLIHALILPAAALVTASTASAALGLLMISVIVSSHWLGINPDNIATPIAASLGDLVTLSILAFTSRAVYSIAEFNVQVALSVSLIVLFLGLLPLWLYIAYCNSTTREVVFSGLQPVFSAMAISSLGGLVLDLITARFTGFALYSPVINGVGGNLVAVQSSRISTSLHSSGSKLGELPNGGDYQYHGVLRSFGSNPHGKTACFLLVLAVPGSLFFLAVIGLMGLGHTSQTAIFYFGYTSAAVLQVAILLLLANWLVHFLWRRGSNPDNSAIPYLTAAGDLLGTGLLAVTWLILWSIGDRDNDVGE